MALFESYERRINQINAVLNSYGISSIEEAEKITKDAGLDVYNMYSKMLAKITNGDYCINNSDNIDRYNSEILSEEGNIIA